MGWQKLSACSPLFSFQPCFFPFFLARDYLDCSGKTSDGKQKIGTKKAKNYCHVTESAALLSLAGKWQFYGEEVNLVKEILAFCLLLEVQNDWPDSRRCPNGS